MSDQQAATGWKGFWNRGGWWKALILAAVYYAVYQGISVFIVGPLFNSIWGDEGTPSFVFFTVALPIILASLLLVGFAVSIGWLKELFSRQPIRGSWWMWISVVVVLGFNIARLVTLDYTKADLGVVAMWLFTGLCIGFAEELLTRGFVVNLMRKAGHREIAVALVSAGVFAALHLGNVFTGQALVPTLIQVAYTFCFGICMYLALRVTGNLIWPILLHATTDPTIFLSSIYPSGSPLAPIAGAGNIAVILTGLVLVFFIRGKVGADRDAVDTAPTPDR